MSYAQITGVPDVKKLVLTLWFRVPQKSVDACAAAAKGDDSILDGIIPLVVMGKQGLSSIPQEIRREHVLDVVEQFYQLVGLTGDVFEVVSAVPLFPGFFVTGRDVVNVPEPTFVLRDPEQFYTDIGNLYATGDPDPTNPTFIGIDCSNRNSPTLSVNFETAQKPTVSADSFNTTITPGTVFGGGGPNPAYSTGISVFTWYTPPFGFIIENDGRGITGVSNTIHDVDYPPVTTSLPVINYTDVSELDVSRTGALVSDQIPITVSKMHQLTISLELKTIETHGRAANTEGGNIPQFVDSASRIFIALDDVNYDGFDLQDFWPETTDKNAFITEQAWRLAGNNPVKDDNDPQGDAILGIARYSIADPVLPLANQPLGMPATVKFVDNIYEVEMGEMRMFTDVTLDTSVEENRRLFLTAKDDKGIQKPAPLSKAEKFFGKKAEVQFHTTGNWQTATNAGTLGDPKHPPGVTAGDIDPYKPKPNLGGDQGKD